MGLNIRKYFEYRCPDPKSDINIAEILRSLYMFFYILPQIVEITKVYCQQTTKSLSILYKETYMQQRYVYLSFIFLILINTMKKRVKYMLLTFSSLKQV